MLVGVGPPEEAGHSRGGKLQKREMTRVLNLEEESSEHHK